MPRPYGQDPSPETLLRQWALDAKTYGITEAVSPWLLETLDASAVREAVFDTLLVRLHAQVLTHDTRAYDVEQTQEVPATWWDHYRDTLWRSSAGPGWQHRAERWLWRKALRADRVTWRTLTAALHVQEFLAYPDAEPADPALARALGRGVPKRIVTLYDAPGGDTEDHD